MSISRSIPKINPNDSEVCFKIDQLANFSSSQKKLKVLVLADQKYPAEVVKDHVDGITSSSRHEVCIRSPRKRRWFIPSSKVNLLDKEGKCFDVVIIHYSLCILFESYIPRYLREEINQFRGIKIQIIQDEYRWINKMMDEISYLGIDAIFSSLNLDNLKKVYYRTELSSVLKVSCLPGYVPQRLVGLKVPKISQREKHLAYRGRELPYWMGRLSYEKSRLSEEVGKRINTHPIVADLSSLEKDRLYGESWTAFLKCSKAVLGLEGGASIFDFDGEAEKAVLNYQKLNPGTGFEEISTNVLLPYEGNVIHQTITPRCFEAIAYKTVQVLLEGEYNGVLKPWKHYLPLKRDFSNLDKIIKFLLDDQELQNIADRAYDEIIHSNLYSSTILGRGIDGAIDLIRIRKENTLCVA